jgi:hypothetical protein
VQPTTVSRQTRAEAAANAVPTVHTKVHTVAVFATRDAGKDGRVTGVVRTGEDELAAIAAKPC